MVPPGLTFCLRGIPVRPEPCCAIRREAALRIGFSSRFRSQVTPRPSLSGSGSFVFWLGSRVMTGVTSAGEHFGRLCVIESVGTVGAPGLTLRLHGIPARPEPCCAFRREAAPVPALTPVSARRNPQPSLSGNGTFLSRYTGVSRSHQWWAVLEGWPDGSSREDEPLSADVRRSGRRTV